MLRSTERLLDEGYGARVFRDKDHASVFGGTPSRRHGLANKAMAKGELVRIKRGLYCIGERYRTASISKFYVANRIQPLSVVSMMSSLSFHGWIPERVQGVQSASIRPQSIRFDTPFGRMSFVPIPVVHGSWMRAVSRFAPNGQPFLVADPLRALMDSVYRSRTQWQGLPYLIDGLRIDPDELDGLDAEDFAVVQSIYRSKRVRQFLEKLRDALEV